MADTWSSKSVGLVTPEGTAVGANALGTKRDVKFRVAVTAAVPAQAASPGSPRSSTCLSQTAGACKEEAPNSRAPVPSAKISSLTLTGYRLALRFVAILQHFVATVTAGLGISSLHFSVPIPPGSDPFAAVSGRQWEPSSRLMFSGTESGVC